MWQTALGVFLIAHGAVTILIWAMPPQADAPMDPGASWLLGEARTVSLVLAAVAGALIAAGGVGLLAGQEWWAVPGLAGGVLSLALFGLFSTRWWLAAIGISSALVVAAAWRVL